MFKHQEFFDSTAGTFKHPFVKDLVNEIYHQRNSSKSNIETKQELEQPNGESNSTNGSSSTRWVIVYLVKDIY